MPATTHRVVLGDSRSMGKIDDASVQLVVTSPPYWQLKDYGPPGQIGFNDSYEDYINSLSLVWSECIRVLGPGCRLCVNIGDQFARAAHYGRYKVIPIRTEITKSCESAGLDFMGSIIWRKVTTCHTTGGGVVMGSFPHPRNGILKIDYEFILTFKKPGKPPAVRPEVKRRSRLTASEWNEYFSGHWSFPGEKQAGHLAKFPLELPRRLIRMFSFEGETVLDPFLGSGTTSLAALELGRSSWGYEINPAFIPAVRERLRARARELGAGVETLSQAGPLPDFKEAVRSLPYIFRDPLKLDRKVDPRKKHYGSSIDGTPAGERGLRTVKAVLSPDLVLLDDGRRVRLLGLRPLPERAGEAVSYLRGATRGQKVYLVLDGDRREQDGTVRAYLHLSNRTFLNAHLIKRGLARADPSEEHRHRERFLRFSGEAPPAGGGASPGPGPSARARKGEPPPAS